MPEDKIPMEIIEIDGDYKPVESDVAYDYSDDDDDYYED